MTHAQPSPSCKQPEKVGLCVCVCVCYYKMVCFHVEQSIHYHYPTHQFSTDQNSSARHWSEFSNQRLFSIHFFHFGPLCVLRVVGKQEDLYIKVFFEGEKKMMFPTSFSVKIKSTQPHLHVFSVIITVFFLFIFFLILLAAFFLLGDFLYAPHFHFIIIIIFIWVCLKSCFLSVNL